jgi:hypothetical protein
MKKALILMTKDFDRFRKGEPLIAEVYNCGFLYKGKAIPKDYAEILAYTKPKKVKPISSSLDILKHIKKGLGL